VSFGLPNRDIINGTFFSLALGRGLSAAIMNPYSDEMMKNYFAYLALAGPDDNCQNFISFAQALPEKVAVTPQTMTADKGADENTSELHRAIVKGLKESAAAITAELIKSVPPLTVVQEEIIPALNTVGVGFENKTVYLPQLLMSAEAAKAAFEKIKESMKGEKAADKCSFVIATVKGDIHDIGKNIVKLLLENYGFNVTDLGRDVAPEAVADEVVRIHAPIAGLSALMTTTVPAMEETIKLLRERAPWCKVIVGGAVLNREYADAIGADKYAKDAMETVRYAEEVNDNF
jgi:5-methyltetrahydrofolate--homocysteine methyltransferase